MKTKPDDSIKLPIKEVICIQEALKPLGYAVTGYREKRGSKTILYLSPLVLFDSCPAIHPDSIVDIE